MMLMISSDVLLHRLFFSNWCVRADDGASRALLGGCHRVCRCRAFYTLPILYERSSSGGLTSVSHPSHPHSLTWMLTLLTLNT